MRENTFKLISHLFFKWFQFFILNSNISDKMTNPNLLVLVGVLVVSALVIAQSSVSIYRSSVCIWPPANQENLDPDVTDYDCDIRIGCNTRDLDQREVTNIVLERKRVGENPSLGSIDLTKWQPGVDRPFIAQLEMDKKLRTEDIVEGLSGRDESDFVFQQFGNDGTVINPRSNPLFRPAPPILA